MNTRDAFAERLVILRSEKGLTQSELAEAIGISRQSVTLYERRTRIPDIEVLTKFATFFGVTSDYLVGISDNRTNETAAIGDRLGLSDEAIEKLKLYFAGDHKPDPTSFKLIQSRLMAQRYIYYHNLLKTLNVLILDERLLASLRNYIFTQIDPMILEYDYCDEDTTPQTYSEQRIEIGQAVNMYQIQKNLIRVWEKQCKEETNAQKD